MFNSIFVRNFELDLVNQVPHFDHFIQVLVFLPSVLPTLNLGQAMWFLQPQLKLEWRLCQGIFMYRS